MQLTIERLHFEQAVVGTRFVADKLTENVKSIFGALTRLIRCDK